MSYSHIKPIPSTSLTEPGPSDSKPRSRCWTWTLLAAGTLILIAVGCAVPVAIHRGREAGPRPDRTPTRAIRKACDLTHYPNLCVESLVNFPGAADVGSPRQLAHMSMNITLERLGSALSTTTEIRNWNMDTLSRSAYEDCLELLESSVDLLARSMSNVNEGGSKQDVMTWLSGAMTNQDTCTDGLSGVSGSIQNQMAQSLQDLSELVSNCLAIYSASNGLDDDLGGTPIQNRRLLGFEHGIIDDSGFPEWMGRSDRELLVTSAPVIEADIIVAQDGSGTVKTISEAIKKAPQYSERRVIIHVKAGTYREKNLKVGRKKTNLWFLGEGKGKTVISGNLSVDHDQVTTFHTATFAATGTGFLARDISFVNEAGPMNHQAVALRVGADHSVVYRCEVKGFQDTLYVHSQRQFFRECDIYGTVDYIFGNAAVVFQNCTMWARKPTRPQEKITVTAQNRKDPNQNTGISIHASQIKPMPELVPNQSTFLTFLGRPWKIHSRVVYMESYIGDHVDPRGWLEWNATSPVDQLYYGEYANTGPRANTTARVKWPGLHVSMSKIDAQNFTVGQFIYGQDWITSTGVAYQFGLSS